MFTKTILTALAVTFVATTSQAAEQRVNERPEFSAPRKAEQTLELPAYKVMSDKERVRANLARLDLVSVSVLRDGTAPADRSSREDY
ncbi:hypothetical protein E4L95_09235 [Paracoccus liaowanqingii]|uniref:Uncharacterized protein n=1 Tax=Paracoccus liaowanqingii TaxID=2560053 RepID=A0A4Z1CGS3_9RHOB|nr:hypothetical protein [Paracoccus liaowanqingii]TGN61739.1 hypothetical protein E4L95_09235 [Paracoccus liaowanqingii]